jgi:hypothetical protein
MNEIRWFNPNQPQTLQGAVGLAYMNSVFALLSLGALARFSGVPWILVVAALVGQVAGAAGVASEKKAGYALAIGASSLLVLTRLLIVLRGGFNANVIGFMFSAALLALLLHEQSRNYQRIWFR